MTIDLPVELSVQSVFGRLNKLVAPMVKAGVGSPLPIGGGMVVLATNGRVSGQRREVPVSAVRLGNRVVVATIRSNSQWYKNLEADPSASIWVGGRERAVKAELEQHVELNVAVLTMVEEIAGPDAG